ncbi:MAG: glutathione S-transferase family protein [Cellvibrionaceae bacterium]
MPTTNESASMELFTYPLTHNPIKIALLLEYINSPLTPKGRSIPITTHAVYLDQLEHHSERFTDINPNQKIPVLVDGDSVLWESNAILHHLNARFESDCWPQNHGDQSHVLRWLMWEASRWNHCIGSLLKNRVYFPFWGYEGNQKEIEKQSQRLEKLLDVLDQELQYKPYLTGHKLTIADIAIAAPLIYASELMINFERHSGVKLWLHQLAQSDWWQACQQKLTRFRKQSSAHTAE